MKLCKMIEKICINNKYYVIIKLPSKGKLFT